MATAYATTRMTTAEDDRLWHHVLSGVSGRVCAETFMSPLNLLKVRLQHDAKLKSKPVHLALRNLFRDEGMALWRGLPPRLMWAAPLAAVTFSYYNAAKSVADGSDKATAAAAAGGADGTRAEGESWISPQRRVVILGPVMLAASVALRTPFDIVEQRLQLLPSDAQVPAYKRALLAMRDVAQKEGWRGLWRGYSAAFCGVGCFVTGYFAVYEAVRRLLGPDGLAVTSETAVNLVAGGVGGGCTAAFATPFDTIKVRMQTRIYATAETPFPSLFAVGRATVRDMGVRGLFRGVAARIASNTPSGAIMFTVYEAGTRSLRQRAAARREAEASYVV